MLRRRRVEFYPDSHESVRFDGTATPILRFSSPSNDTPLTLSDHLLRRSLRCQGGDGHGELYCHPTQHNDIATWLSQHAHLGWHLGSDTTLKPGEMRLVTEGGEFMLRW